MFSYFRQQHRRAGSTPQSPESPIQWHYGPSPLMPAEQPAESQTTYLRPLNTPTPQAVSPVSSLPPILPPIQRVTSTKEQEQRLPARESRPVADAPRLLKPDSRQSPSDSRFPLPNHRPLSNSRSPSLSDIRPPDLSGRRRDFTSIVSTLTIPDLPVLPRPAQSSAPPPQQLQQQQYHPTLPPQQQQQRPPKSQTLPLPQPQQHQLQQQQHASPKQTTERPSLSPRTEEEQQQPAKRYPLKPMKFPHEQLRPAEDNERSSRHNIPAHVNSQRKPPPPLLSALNSSREQLHRPSSSSSHLAHELQAPPHIPVAKRAPSPSSSLSSSMNLPAESPTNPAPKSPQAPITSVPKAQKPSRINLLNPMSLLLRRRSSNNDAMPDGHLVAPRNREVPSITVPDDYDPRIRGKGVHDFNAPRPKRKSSEREDKEAAIRAEEARRETEEPLSKQSTVVDSALKERAGAESVSGESKTSLEKQHHTPVFIEHFDDDDIARDDAGVRREGLANAAFLARMSRQFEFSDGDTTESQSSNRKLTAADTSPEGPSQPKVERMSKQTEASSQRISSDQSTARSSIVSDDTRATSPPQSPSHFQSRSSPASVTPPQPSALPKHLSSTASRASSRFSFQLGNDRSNATEKSLEEKHKQRFAARLSKHGSLVEDEFEASDDDDYDNFDTDNGGYEEEIPYINADEDDDEFGIGQPMFRSIDKPKNPVRSDKSDSVYSSNKSASTVTRGSSKGTKKLSFSLEEDDMYYDDGFIQDEPPPDQEGEAFDESELDRMEKKNSDDWNKSPTTSLSYAPSLIQPQLNPPSLHNLNAYHSALASAATKAAADGRFVRESSAVAEESSPGTESSEQKEPVIEGGSSGEVNEEQPLNVFSNSYEDFDLSDDLEDDPMIAAANAEALAADDSGFYGREFGFYGHSVDNSVLYNGGYFGEAGADGIGRSASGRNVSREPNLTPITERSEFSTRNSVISMNHSGFFSGPSSGVLGPAIPWEQSLPSPGLKELASMMGPEEDDMSLSQLMKLRKGAFGEHRGSWTGGSAGSAPSSPGNGFVVSSPLYAKSSTNPDTHKKNTTRSDREMSEPATNDDRSEYELHDDDAIDEANQFSGSDSGSCSPVRSNNAADFCNGGGADEATPRPKRPSSHTLMATAPSQPLPRPPMFMPVQHSPSPISPSYEAVSAAPMPSANLMNKFASRPQAASYHSPTQSQSHTMLTSGAPALRPNQRLSSGAGANSHGHSNSSGDSVAYVKEETAEGEADVRWYLERRRRLSTGEVVVVGRELVEGGRI